MKKLITILFFTLYMGASNAEMSYGISGALAHVEAKAGTLQKAEKLIVKTLVTQHLFHHYS